MEEGLLESMERRLSTLESKMFRIENVPAVPAPTSTVKVVGNELEIFGHGQDLPTNLPPDPSEISKNQGFQKE